VPQGLKAFPSYNGMARLPFATQGKKPYPDDLRNQDAARPSGRRRVRDSSTERQRAAVASIPMTFEDALIEVWRQVLLENEDVVKLGATSYPVTMSKAKRLRQVAFVFDGKTVMGIEQNPKTKSRWALMARSGKKVMQFIQDRQYIAVVADGKVILYGK